MFERLGAVGRDVGITFSFGGKTGVTRDSHRLIQLGKKSGAEAQTKVVQGLFEAYFERERDITDWAVLQDVGVKAGLGEEQARAWLEGDLGGSEVDREVEEARVKGINGVPHFTIQGVHELGGAQDPEAFVRVFEKVKGMEGK